MDIRFSIIIPYYNRRSLLKRGLESVYLQTIWKSQNSFIYPNQFISGEIILVDDCSHPSESISEEDMNRWKEEWGINQDISVKIFAMPQNYGVSKARNIGVEQSKGEWIFFMDSDDVWKPEKISRQFDYIISNPDILIHQTEEIWIRKGKFVNPKNKHRKTKGDIFKDSLENCMITPSSVCLHRSLWNEFKGMDEDLPACEDYDLWLAITNRYNVGLLEESLMIRYGGHPDQLSGKFPAMDRFRIYSLLKRGIEFTDSNRKLAHPILVQKLKILIEGRKKRKKDTMVLEEILAWTLASYEKDPIRIQPEWKNFLLNHDFWN